MAGGVPEHKTPEHRPQVYLMWEKRGKREMI
jgi:hypothetical protein